MGNDIVLAIAIRANQFGRRAAKYAILQNGETSYHTVGLPDDCYADAQAECIAIIAACSNIADMQRGDSLKIITSSQLLIKQLAGEWKVKPDTYHAAIFPTMREGIELVNAELKTPTTPTEIHLLKTLKNSIKL
jgi:ribonuclease HI